MWCGVVQVICLVVVAQPLAAQVTDSTATDLRTLLGVADNRHWYVRVETADSSRFEGNVTRAPGDAIRVGSVELPIAAIRALYQRTAVVSGTDEGMVAGGILFGLLGMGIAAIACSYSEGRCNPALAYAIGAAGGATIGLVIGGLAGSMFHPGRHVWELRWRAR